ncbi:MAG: chitobiase/beta-hexosaminidase C-terminal domain-containing protein [Treponema sp.]|nr:chitobiase/beta-hexosaminidase C-terminal domain-containing protein [Treponema sp.]
MFINISVFALTKADIISPVPGTWNNKQPLVISIANYHPDIEIYYTTSGADPYQSGFAYDGPVLLEESGPVNLKIAAIDNSGKRQDFQINYRVQEENISDDSFIKSISK